jgi:transposase InsO family protein
MRKRYRATAGRRARSELLDELESVAGLTRKHAITLMNQQTPAAGKSRNKRSGRPRSYLVCMPVVEAVWEALDYCCAERLHPQLLPLSESLDRHKEIQVTLEAREELHRISRATLARRLRELPRGKPRLVASGQHPNRLLKSLVPVDRYRWNEARPGALEIDLVEHSGGVGKGHHAFTLSVVDVVTGWSRRKAVMGKSQAVVHEALAELLSDWPCDVWALHSDNGNEFLGAHLIHYCKDRGIEYHRSRPYKKNDNAHVEQKNRQLVREVVGYERIDTPHGVAWLNAIYELLDPYANLILPSLKVIEKTRVGSKIKKRYDTARTPLERLQATNVLTAEAARNLAAQQHAINPLELRRQLNRLQAQEPQPQQLPEAAD